MAVRLSVIVPIYNVETYLPACLDSLRAQTFQDLEVIMVDDGSPDDSARIAADYAELDERFHLVRKANAGLGAARNTGLEHLSPSSEYIAFVDSDDVIPPDAYRLMVSSLDESGSDFATGNVHHLRGENTWQVPLLKMLSGEAVRRTHISERPALVADRIACNKVWRRTFWDEGTGRFPEGVWYEDTPVTVPAHYRARAVDIIGEPVYFWRLREGEGGLSITQRRTEPQGVYDRVGACLAVSEFLTGRSGPEWTKYKHQYDDRVLRDDLRLFLRVLPEGNAEYHTAFLKAANKYLDTVDPEVVLALPTDLRVQWLLVRKHALTELLALLASQRRKDPVGVSGALRKYAEFAPLEKSGLSLPKSFLRIDPDLSLRAPVEAVEWQNGKLVLRGDAWIDKIDMPSKRGVVKVLQLTLDKSKRRMFLPAHNVHSPLRTTASGGKIHNYDWAGWEVAIDPAKFRKGGKWIEGVWHVGINLHASGLVRRGAVWARGASGANFPPYHWLDRDHRLVPYAERGALKMRLERVKVLVTDRRRIGERLEIGGELRTELKSEENLFLRLSNPQSGERMEYPAEVNASGGFGTFRAQVPLVDTAIAGEEGEEATRTKKRQWSTVLVAKKPDGTERRFSSVVAEGLADLSFALPPLPGIAHEHHEVAVTSGNNGYLKIIGRTQRAVLTRVAEENGALTLRGHAPLSRVGDVLVLKARGRFEHRTVPVDWNEDGTFSVTFDPSSLGGKDGGLPLKAGRWNFHLRSHAEDVPELSFVNDRLVLRQFPLRATLGGRRYWIENLWGFFPQLNCRTELSDMESGPTRQAELQRTVYKALREGAPLRDQVFYLSYNGKQYSDSPRAMHEELLRRGSRLRHLWAVRDGQVVLPPSAEKVRMWGTEWFEALATSRYIVTNGHLPEWVERRPGQVIVQTWHGTMLKKIGHDIETLYFDKEYQNRLAVEANNWSLLVSSNRFSTPILKRAFSYDGEILEAGYPRNDQLYAADRDKIAEAARQTLGVPAGKKVILYAPTWRDDKSHSAGQYRFDMKIDLEDAQRRLGDEYVLVVRKHSNVVDAVPGAGNGFVIDASEYPDVAELYLAADVMITDYSSVMFDYAHLRRPMVFFTYDLEHYRDKLRGFYFDFEKSSPGPLVSTSEELVDALANITTVSAQYRERFEEFHYQFCDLDDGMASARVVDRMLEQSQEARYR
ncbi:bifunctional glycosyltransferase family 2 protein/CDP-glycerol:glycerophosphate glycerophosphotransferase [Streptomyces sp. NPDC006684]|uniref:bifunctional glycosyltransferase/CDP-glycerol:glycerophosphate glycerophosphotransferase n=1 Tax=Streptomyces sp. NPDC006684 TaxID=3154477 RepID=UPI003456C5BA